MQLLRCRSRLFQGLLRILTTRVVAVVVIAAIVIALGNLIQLLSGRYALGITRYGCRLLSQRFRRIRMRPPLTSVGWKRGAIVPF